MDYKGFTIRAPRNPSRVDLPMVVIENERGEFWRLAEDEDHAERLIDARLRNRKRLGTLLDPRYAAWRG